MRDAAYTYFGFEKRVIIANHQEMTTAKRILWALLTCEPTQAKLCPF